MRKELQWGLLITGILSVIAGIYVIAQPMVSLVSLSIFFDEIDEIEKTMIDNVNLFYEEQTEFIF